MFEIQDNSIIEKFTYNDHGVSTFRFNDKDPDKFFISDYLSNNLEMRRVEDNAILLKIDVGKNPYFIETIPIQNADPVSGYLLINGFKVLDMNSGTIVFEIANDHFERGWLFNYRIYTFREIAISISSEPLSIRPR